MADGLKKYGIIIHELNIQAENKCEKEKTMANLKIQVSKIGNADPEKTITIPGDVFKIASKLIPKVASAALQDKGIDLDELIKLSKNPQIRGTLVEVEDHKKNEKVVISLE